MVTIFAIFCQWNHCLSALCSRITLSENFVPECSPLHCWQPILHLRIDSLHGAGYQKLTLWAHVRPPQLLLTNYQPPRIHPGSKPSECQLLETHVANCHGHTSGLHISILYSPAHIFTAPKPGLSLGCNSFGPFAS